MSKQIHLDDEERDLLESYEAGEWTASEPSASFAAAAKATLAKTRRVNIRLTEMDLVGLQRRAAREGMPAQTLMGSILHKYAVGMLREVG